MTKTIEDYPELNHWLLEVASCVSMNSQIYYDEKDVEQKLIEMQAKSDAQQERISELENGQQFAVLQARVEEGNKHLIADTSWSLQRVNYLNSELDKLNKESK